MKRRLIVIESPYAGDVEANTRYARECVMDSLRRGEAPYASHLFFTQPGLLDDNLPEERALGIEAGLAWAAVPCVKYVGVYLDRGLSAGMRYGIARHLKMGKRIFLRSLGTPPSLAREERFEPVLVGEGSCVCRVGNELCAHHIETLQRFPLP